MKREFRKPKIISPMAKGNGAHVVHCMLEKYIVNYNVFGYNPLYTLLPFALRGLVSNGDYDILHTTPDYAPFFTRGNRPTVVSFQNYVLDRWMDSYSSLFQRIHYKTDLRLYTRLAVRKASVITAVSAFTAEIVKKDLKIDRSIKLIYNSVDESVFTPRRFNEPGAKEVCVFFSGNLTQRKGAQWITDITNKLQSNVVIHYTQGLRTRRMLPDHPNLKSIGSVPFEQMPLLYRKMDILLMPTVREGLSLSVLEAMACGLPVVASDCSSLPEQIDEGKGGFLCPVGEVDMFAERLNYLADSPNLRKEMGQYNRSKVEKYFTVKRMVKEYRKLFDRILV